MATTSSSKLQLSVNIELAIAFNYIIMALDLYVQCTLKYTRMKPYDSNFTWDPLDGYRV